MPDVTMLTSLKALLFSSAATQMPADGAGALAIPAEGATDFAQLLNGTMDAAPDGKQPLATLPAAPADATPEVMEGKDGGTEPPAPLPFGLANALQAVQSHRKDSLPLPPGLAAKIEAPAAPADDAAAPVAAGEPVEEIAAETPVLTPVENSEPDAPDLSDVKPHEQPKAARPVKEAKLEKGELLPAMSPGEQPDEPVKADQADKDKPKHQADTVSLPLPPVAAVPTPTAQSVPASTPAPERETPPVNLETDRKPLREAQISAQASEQPILAGPAASVPAAGPKTAVSAAVPDSAPVTTDQPVPETSSVESRPLRSDALALLQMVRDQVAVRQPGTPVRAGEPLAVRAKTGRAAAPAEAAPVSATQPASADAAPLPSLVQPSAVPTVQSGVAVPPAVDLSASLGAQMVDMGVSGQWIDGLARDIAGLSANGAQGRFQINADQLGAVQVDIRHGSDGAAVSLTVASEAAEMALRQDSDRLRLDAGLSAVRISEVKIERAPHVAEAARADSANQQGSQQQSSQTANSWGGNGQNMAQSQGQAQGQAQGQGRWRPQENSAFSPKNSGDPAVLNHDDMRRAANDAVRARYA